MHEPACRVDVKRDSNGQSNQHSRLAPTAKQTAQSAPNEQNRGSIAVCANITILSILPALVPITSLRCYLLPVGKGPAMTKSVLSLALLCAVLGAAPGCRLLCGTPDGLCPPGFCNPQHCADGCGWAPEDDSSSGCGLALSRRPLPAGWRAPDCGQGWDQCDADCRPGFCRGGPLRWLYRLLTRNCYWGRSCGEVYWGDWWNDPPDCCDPCDRCGNFTGVHVRGCVGNECDDVAYPAVQSQFNSGCQQCGQAGRLDAIAKTNASQSMPHSAAPSGGGKQTPTIARPTTIAGTTAGPPAARPSAPRSANAAPPNVSAGKIPRTATAPGGKTVRTGPDNYGLTVTPGYYSPDAAARGEYSPRLISVEERVLSDVEVAARQTADRSRPADNPRR